MPSNSSATPDLRHSRNAHGTWWRSSASLAAALASATVALGPSDAAADGLGYDGLPPQELCGLCHGLNGISATAKFPKLAGQKVRYIEKQLRDFLQRRRTNDGGQMASIVTEIKPTQFAAAARHFASQPPPKPDVEAIAQYSTTELKSAEAIYLTGRSRDALPACASCHENLNSKLAHAPRLTSQNRRYLAKQLRDFKTGERKNDASGTMASIAAKLPEREIQLLAAFLAARPRSGDQYAR